MTTQATTPQRVQNATTLNHGDYVQVELKGETIEGRITIETPTRYFFCSNNPLAKGSDTENKQGYLYSWTFDPNNVSAQRISNIYLIKRPKAEAKRVPPSKRTLATSYYLDKEDITLAVQRLKTSVPRREKSIAKKYFNLQIEGNRYGTQDSFLIVPTCDTPYQIRLCFRYRYKHSKTRQKISSLGLADTSYEVITFDVKPLEGKHGKVKARYKPTERALQYLAIKDLTPPKTIKTTANTILRQLADIYPNAKLERTGF